MANIVWSVADFFVCPNSAKKTYGIVTSAKKKECVLVTDTGLRTGRFNIAPASIPSDAEPSYLKGVDFPVKMALAAISVALRRSEGMRVL